MAELDMKSEAVAIFKEAVSAVLPNEAVRRALAGRAKPAGRRLLVAIGKAAWQMASSAYAALNGDIDGGVVITKYHHSHGDIPNVKIFEAGHPIPDENTFIATAAALELTSSLQPRDEVIFLVSGGGSALFEKSRQGVSDSDIVELTEILMACGASIDEINTLRKRCSAVKGGRFAAHCAPATIYQIVLSDVVGDRLDSIASGPACVDSSTSADARRIVERYKLRLPPHMRACIDLETPKRIENVETSITGSVRYLCEAAAAAAEQRCYKHYLLTTTLDCEAREAGRFTAAIAREIRNGSAFFQLPCAVIMGGETVVHLRGKGKGGRNQELALAAAEGIKGLNDVVVLSAGSDGTDGPTDAAGGVVCGASWDNIRACGVDAPLALEENNSYNALKAAGLLVMTGPTGTNVNDLLLILCR